MKKILFVVVIVLALALSACASQAPAEQVSISGRQGAASTTQSVVTTGTASRTAVLDTSYDNAAPVAEQLLLETLKLNGSDQAVTKEQAAVLLPLWTQYQNLMMSMGAGQAQSSNADVQSQMEALVSEIQSAMTIDQIKAIAAYKITPQSAQTILQDLGITMGAPQQPANSQPGGASPSNAMPPQGTPPAPPSGANPPSGDATPPGGAGAASGGMMPPDVINALIQSLSKINGSSAAVVAAGTGATQPPSGIGSSSTYTITAVYEQDGGSQTMSSETYKADQQDQSAVYVANKGTLTLSNATITTTGNTSSADNSSFHGLNAAVLAAGGSSISLTNSSITTSGTGANGAFATDSGSSVSLSNVTIEATGDGGHGVMATNGGALTLTNVDMSTAGKNSGALATDRGGGTITASGGTVTTSGQDSPAIYSTGSISVSRGTLIASGAEAAVIEGANSITLTDSSLSSSKGKWGVMIYQSMSGDAQGTEGVFTMTGGKLEYTPNSGPVFYVTNSTGLITLKGVQVLSGSTSLVKASAGNWGSSGSNSGTVVFKADNQVLKGDLSADAISSIDLTLQNGSSLEGAINTEHTAKAITLTLDASSTWNLTADSYLTSLSDSGGISGTSITNITGNGHTVYYDTSASPELGGQTYSLSGGGLLSPANG